MLNLQRIYDDHLLNKNEAHRKKRYDGKEQWFHASASGMCMRKHYFQHIAKVKPKPVNEDTMRLFRLGDLVHEDIQNALREYAENNGSKIYIEKEIQLPEVNVRGFLDIIVIDDGILYDIKTCNSWKWKNLFGRYPDPNPSINYHLQLGTYGWWYEKSSRKKLKKLCLLYYNKEYDETFTLIICNDFKYCFMFVGVYLNDSLQNQNIQDIRSTFNYEYTYYKDEDDNYISFLIKDNE